MENSIKTTDIYNSKHFLEFVEAEKVKSHDPMTILLVVVDYFLNNYSEEYEYCPVCQSPTPTSKIILCDKCDYEMCFSCAKLKELPTGKWYCSSSCEVIPKCGFCKLEGHNIRTCPEKLKMSKNKMKRTFDFRKVSIPKGLEIKSKGWSNSFKNIKQNLPRNRIKSKKCLESYSGLSHLKSPKITNFLNLKIGQNLWANWEKSIDKDGFKLWWPCKVYKIKSDNCYDVIYEDGDIEYDIKYYSIRKTRPVG